MGGLTPSGEVYTLARQESLNGLHTVAFLWHLLRVAGPRLWVLWDGSPIHRRAAVKEFVSGTGGKVWREALPGYAPDLNAWDEGGWITSRMWRCASWCVTTWRNCTKSSTSPSPAYVRSPI